ncbi:MAG: thioredoxin [Limisphaerales bacterium]|jgi:thioredoxin 1|nr:thioredoxin [Pedosphaera sp.]RZO71554.1 MAG: thioredoxin [Limisphaerales bacterium]HAQ97904.1 thioredoxin [Verrucomicrobiales bacterium]HAW00146.1 thioredoxin [Verrucomicrobiales bacterium]HCZ04417.1 thioredoxin [Verrucomicrobiales bacterium]|tara:strand:- start:1576 stop:2061 length:486 start_codon:yes stop_codon:yes gene_type:complete
MNVLKNKWIKVSSFVLLTALTFFGYGCGSGNPYVADDGANHSDAIQVVTDVNFAGSVLGADKPVLVDFWATWCGPCLQMAPAVSQLADEYKDRAIVAKVDVDKNPDISNKYDISAIPTFIVFNQGEEVMRYTGSTTIKGLRSMLDKQLTVASKTEPTVTVD